MFKQLSATLPLWLVSVATGLAGTNALLFDGVNDYVTFGAATNANNLGVTNFTIECWFKRQGTGDTASTGTGGIANGVPLVSKGRQQVDGDNRDMNFFLGISGTVLAADFEDMNNGANHPVFGVTASASNAWQHAAVTYHQPNGTWVLYLNGIPDVTNVVSGTASVRTPRADSIQHAALASALQSTGAADGFFNGSMDEVRIWNYARSAAQIAGSYYLQITNDAGLIARWSLDEGAGTTATNSINGGVNGRLTNGPAWTAGYPFASGPPNNPPGPSASNSPTNGTVGASTSPTLSVTVSDPETNNLTVTFYGRVASPPAGADFTLVALPDTQHYVSSIGGGSPAMFTNQTQWIVNERVNRNIQYVAQLGDCVQNGDNGGNNVEWRHATNALYRLENPVTTMLPDGIPYGVAVGNHDQTPLGSATGTTTFYNQYFGEAHFLPYDYYGGHYGSNNDNHYDLFSASGLDFIVIYFEFNSGMATNSPVLAWANDLLQTHVNRRAILVSHYIMNEGLNASFGSQGSAMYNALKGNTNLFLMLCGHIHVTTGEGRRSDTFNNRTVWTVLSDYQDRTGGGNGLLRLNEFSPSNNVIRVKTYSPWINQFETDADSQFDIPYAMTPTNPFTVIGTSAGVPSGSAASIPWINLTTNTAFEWYVTVSDGTATTTSPVWRFTTGSTPTITKSNATVTLGNLSQVYDGTARNATAATVPAGLAVDLTYAGSAAAPTNAGNYVVIGTINETNYAGAATNTLTIAAHSLSAVADNASRAYGQPNPVFTGILTGVQSGDNITASYSSPATTDSLGGSYEIVPALIDPAGRLGNYAVTLTSGVLTVIGEPLLLSASESPEGYCNLVWQVYPGRTYRFQFKNSLSDPDWTTDGVDYVAVSSSVATGYETGTNHHGFYRVLDVTDP